MEVMSPTYELGQRSFPPISSGTCKLKLLSVSSRRCRSSVCNCKISRRRFQARVSRNSLHDETVKPSMSVSGTVGERLCKLIVKSAFNLAAGAAALLSVYCVDSPAAFAESLTVAFPVSRTSEANTVQRTLIEAWGLIRESFVDPTFNHQDWDMKLQQTMVEIFPLKSADAAYGKVKAMLASLGDPFTRIISPKEYQSFRIGSNGNLQGVGLFVSANPSTGHLIVLSCVEDSPAARANIHEGDELIEIDGVKLDGADSETVVQKLRGRAGTTVRVKVRDGWRKYRTSRRLFPIKNTVSLSSFGLAVKSGTNDQSIPRFREVNLSREFIKFSPISSAIIPHVSPDGHMSRMGYLRLAAFSQTAALDMEKAVHHLEDQGVRSYILDLRNNPGGLVKAGLDVAQIWLDGDETLVNTIDREGHLFPISTVNEGSASASEILAGALHDNGRAILVGNQTFGKGKIQSVTELHDGSALFVTVAKYLSPSLHEIDKVGIAPDVKCSAELLSSPDKSAARSALEADSCIMVAEHELDVRGTAS